MDLKLYYVWFGSSFCLLYNVSMANEFCKHTPERTSTNINMFCCFHHPHKFISVTRLASAKAPSGALGLVLNKNKKNDKTESEPSNISGLYQSPINIITTKLSPIAHPHLNNPFLHWKKKTSTVTCTNDGTVIHGGPLGDDIYKFSHCHFHWGRADTNGSEHGIDGRLFASELHAVFYNSKYEKTAAAIDQDDGLCVLGWFGLLWKEDSEQMNKLFEQVSQITEYGASFEGEFRQIFPFLEELAETNCKLANWITYKGSRTVAPYYESVTWIIYDKPFAISKQQLQQFRNLKGADGTPILEYTRDIFPLYGRVVSKPMEGRFETTNDELISHLLP